MSEIQKYTIERKKIAIRLLYTILNFVVLEILKVIIQVTVIFQYVYLFITRTHNEPIRKFANKIATYAYRVIRYLSLNESTIPFPFSDFPPEIEPPEQQVTF